MTDPDLFVCPVCGEEVPANARACPGCGADENTGWNQQAAQHDGLDLPDDEFDYDEFVKNELGSSPKPRRIAWLWWLAGIVTVLVFLWLLLGGVLG